MAVKLSDIDHIREKLRSSSSKCIKALHKLIFETEGDRGNRERLRNFTGFDFSLESEEFTKKFQYSQQCLSDGDVISICNILGMDYTGSKEELTRKICTCLTDCSLLSLNVNSEDEADETSSENVEEEKSELNDMVSKLAIRSTDNVCSVREQVHFAMSFRDIEDSIRPFSGSDDYPVKQWISDFDDTASVFGWNDMQKLIYAKRSLTGLAKLFIQGEKVMKTYGDLKRSLVEEFHTDVNSACLHEKLRNRRMARDETVQEYFLSMRALASTGQVEDEALMTYVINGIHDDERNKISLYGAKDIRDFKERLRTYETVYRKAGAGNRSISKTHYAKKQTFLTDTYKSIGGGSSTFQVRCFNCGLLGHKAINCKNKGKGLKCFKCNEYGHRAVECCANDNKGKSDKNLNSISTKPLNDMHKLVLIENVKTKALIDTGSEITVINQNTYERLGSPKMDAADVELVGFGNNKVKPIGSFRGVIRIDDHEFTSKIYVVPDNVSKENAIIGKELLEYFELIINRETITVNRTAEEMSLMNIEIENENIFDTDFNVTGAQKDEIRQLIEGYVPQKTKTTDIKMSITVKSEQPIFHRPRRLPFAERDIVDKQIEEWIQQEIIEPSSSEYSSQVVVVKKKDGTPRVCIDYRKLNQIIVKDRYPLPLIEDVLDKLQAARVFSTVDLKNGFFHVEVDKDSKHYTSFVTHNGQFQFLRVPFGLCNSPSVFQRFINTVFRPLINKGVVLPYMDDIIIPAVDEKEGIERLKQFLEVAQSYGLEINFKKSHFLKKRVEFLGHIIEEGQISPSPLKTKAVTKFPQPTNLKQVQSFLGLTGYFRKFILNYAVIAKPLSDLLKKGNKFKFGEEEKSAFNLLKKLLSEKPVLGIYNQHCETEVHTDASIDGYGAVLLQRSQHDNSFHPIYYMSRKTTDAERKYSSYQLEVLAVIEALKKFRIYLLGIQFKIVTDCSAFQKTMNKRDLTTRVARWALLLEEFNYTIEHRSGSKMSHVDALSRNPSSILFVHTESALGKFKKAQEEDPEIKVIKELLKLSEYDNYCERNGVIYKFVDGHEVIVVPESMQTEIIKSAHGDSHVSSKRTEDLLKQDFYIPKVKQKIENFISSCVPCIMVNRKSGKQEGYLHPLHKEDLPLHTYHIDHLGPLESTNKNYKYILAIIDGFTKFVWLYPTKSVSTKEVIAKLDLQQAIFGNPAQIISDRGTAFTSNEFEEYCSKENIKHVLTTTGLPRANGQVERLNRIIVSVLAKLSLEDPSKWYKFVNKLQLLINSTFQRSISTTPFELLFGTKMKLKENEKLKETLEAEMQANFEENRDELRKEAKRQIVKVQDENRRTFNRRRRKPQQYKVNDLVAVKRTQFGPGLKLKPKFLGPYRVAKVKNNDTYDVVKEGFHEGPLRTSTCAEYMKAWAVT